MFALRHSSNFVPHIRAMTASAGSTVDAKRKDDVDMKDTEEDAEDATQDPQASGR
jgi:hypothetical protein